jgi:hypothetical protein
MQKTTMNPINKGIGIGREWNPKSLCPNTAKSRVTVIEGTSIVVAGRELPACSSKKDLAGPVMRCNE